MFLESEYIQLSALQHYLFCPRQCALAYMELCWAENLFTAEGRLMHEKVHSGKFEKRGNVIKAYGLWISSSRLGLTGQTDLVEFHKTDIPDKGVQLPEYSGRWQVLPVEYKSGKPKTNLSDEVQLCAQALCLEEMLSTSITEGDIFYGKIKRKHTVLFDKNLRCLTEKTTQTILDMFKSESTPTEEYSKKCDSCSLYEQCLPKTVGKKKTVSLYLNKIIDESL